jgi:nuclear transport factor 2 (NTF2) superfamily protein
MDDSGSPELVLREAGSLPDVKRRNPCLHSHENHTRVPAKQWINHGNFLKDVSHMNEQPKTIATLAPPFTKETAILKVRAAEDNWNSRNPEQVARGYTVDSHWRNRSEFLIGRAEIIAFLTRKWTAEREYRLIKELWGFDGNRIAVRFAYESQDQSGQWYRSYGNENWEFDASGLMQHRYASINDLPIGEQDRLFHWPLGPRPAEHPGLSDLGL